MSCFKWMYEYSKDLFKREISSRESNDLDPKFVVGIDQKQDTRGLTIKPVTVFVIIIG